MGALVRELRDAHIALVEPGFAVREIELPQAAEAAVEAGARELVGGSHTDDTGAKHGDLHGWRRVGSFVIRLRHHWTLRAILHAAHPRGDRT